MNELNITGCFHTWPVVSDPGVFLPLVRFFLGICEHCNHARFRAKAICPRSPERGGNKLWIGLVVVRKQFDPTDQITRISQCMMGNYVSYVKSSSFVVLPMLKMNRGK